MLPVPSRLSRGALVVALTALVACGGGGSGGDGGYVGGGGGDDGGGGDGGGGAVAPAAPTALSAIATSESGVALTWTPPAGNLLRYEVERATSSGGPFALVASPPASASGHGDGGLTAGTLYVYRVRAVNGAGSSPWTAEVSATPTAVSGPAAPLPPGGLVVTALGSTSLRVDWLDRSEDELSFEIERASAAGGPYGQVQVTGPNAQSWTDTGLTPDTAYHYRVRAVNAAGASSFVSAAAASTAALPTPAPPTGLSGAQEVTGSTAVVRLTWTDAASDETRYEVERSNDGAAWSAMAQLPAGTASYVDGTAVFGTYHYRVRAGNPGGVSAWAQTSVYFGPFVIGTLCPVTEGTFATALSQTSIRVGFTWNICGGVALERATSAAGPWTEVVRLGNYVFGQPANFTWDDTGLAPGTAYHYRIRTLPLVAPSPAPPAPPWSPSGYTATFSATTQAAVTVAAPTGLGVTVLTATTARLDWTDVAQDETAYAIEYATAAAGPFQEAFRVAANSSGAGVSDLTPATPYWVRVRAVKGAATSAPSNVAAFTSATRALLRTTGDTTVMQSTSLSSNQDVPLPSGPDDVGCFFTWLVGPSGQALYHNCGGTALRFDTTSLAGKTVLQAALVMVPCALAPHPVNDARYMVRALASAWNPTTVTFNTLPEVYPDGAWWVPAPQQGGAQAWDVTSIVKNWVGGVWGQYGLYVGQSPIVDRIPTWNGQQWDNQDQVTSYCSLEQNGGSIDYAPALHVDYR